MSLFSNNTSEHEVFHRVADNRAVKVTWPGFYGQIPVLRHRKLDRASATPSQYLERQALQNEVFFSGIRPEGVNTSDRPSMVIGEKPGQPRFVISQPWIRAADFEAPHPSDQQIAAFMDKYGFEPVPGSYFGWARRADGVAVVDARPDNFILSPEGVVPIDLQMSVIPELREAPGESTQPGSSAGGGEAPGGGAAATEPDLR